MKPGDAAFVARVGEPAWPAWVTEFRPHQVTATQQILDAYEGGADVVFLDAPVGSGKTLIAEMVRRLLGVRGVYVCNGKDLQHQFANDYPYAKVLKGRGNYPTEFMRSYTAGDCPSPKMCGWCESAETCPYQMARVEAGSATVAVLNTAYFLAETRGKKSLFAGRELVVADESDTLEGILMGHVEFRVTGRQMRELTVWPVVKSARVDTVKGWLQTTLMPAIREAREKLGASTSVEVIRERNRLNQMAARANRVIQTIGGEVGWGDWVRDYDDRYPDDLILKPVKVDEVGAEMLWPNGQKWLCMSGSIISADEQVESLGVEKAGLRWDVVTVPMTFPKENRVVKYQPTGDMGYKTIRNDTPKIVAKIAEIIADNADDNVLVHAVNYRLAADIADGLRGVAKVHTYRTGKERADALGQFLKEGGVLVAPSMDRGIDLAEDLCRIVVIAKVPFPSLGDRQVEARMRLPGGQAWYSVAVARTLLQMCGRGVRSETDSATTYILDRQFGKWWTGMGRKFMPAYWKEALTS